MDLALLMKVPRENVPETTCILGCSQLFHRFFSCYQLYLWTYTCILRKYLIIHVLLRYILVGMTFSFYVTDSVLGQKLGEGTSENARTRHLPVHCRKQNRFRKRKTCVSSRGRRVSERMR